MIPRPKVVDGGGIVVHKHFLFHIRQGFDVQELIKYMSDKLYRSLWNFQLHFYTLYMLLLWNKQRVDKYCLVYIRSVDIQKLRVVGGNLDHSQDLEVLRRKVDISWLLLFSPKRKGIYDNI